MLLVQSSEMLFRLLRPGFLLVAKGFGPVPLSDRTATLLAPVPDAIVSVRVARKLPMLRTGGNYSPALRGFAYFEVLWLLHVIWRRHSDRGVLGRLLLRARTLLDPLNLFGCV